jgi:acyl dehydratase
VQDDVADRGLLHHEDLVVGTPYVFASRTVTRDEIAAFGAAYDPQPPYIAVDGALSATLCASPLHTCTIMMRMLCDGLLNRVASLGAPGVDEVTWLLPVRPGDVVRTRYTVVAKRTLASRPDVGISKVVVELLNGKGALATRWITNQLSRQRCPAAPDASTPRSAAARQPLVSLWQEAGPAAAPRCDAFFEDSCIGETTEFGSHVFNAEEIVAFARCFDPQPFHLDPARAKASLFGALCASGWHTIAIFLRKSVSARVHSNAAARVNGNALPAVEPPQAWRDLRWPRPVYAGDAVAFRSRLVAKDACAGRPDRGVLVHEVQGRNQNGHIVLAFTVQTAVERRAPCAS